MSDDYCFACGEKNPIGLHLTFDFDGEQIFTRKILPKEFQGYDDTAHGGIIATILDETMCKFIAAKYKSTAVTAKLEVRYKFPTPIEHELKFSAREVQKRQNFVTLNAKVQLPDGKITAEATAIFAVESLS